jgi:hypothetical protein
MDIGPVLAVVVWMDFVEERLMFAALVGLTK